MSRQLRMLHHTEVWANEYIASAGDDGLRNAGLSAHERRRVWRSKTTADRLTAIGPDRFVRIVDAFLGRLPDRNYAHVVRTRVEWYLDNVADLNAAPEVRVWPFEKKS